MAVSISCAPMPGYFQRRGTGRHVRGHKHDVGRADDGHQLDATRDIEALEVHAAAHGAELHDFKPVAQRGCEAVDGADVDGSGQLRGTGDGNLVVVRARNRAADLDVVGAGRLLEIAALNFHPASGQAGKEQLQRCDIRRAVCGGFQR